MQFKFTKPELQNDVSYVIIAKAFNLDNFFFFFFAIEFHWVWKDTGNLSRGGGGGCVGCGMGILISKVGSTEQIFFLKKLGSWEQIFGKISVFGAEILQKSERNGPKKAKFFEKRKMGDNNWQ